jgi:hypothetical protein
MTAQYIYLVIFFCIGYLIVTDQSIAKAVVFVTQFVKIQIEKFIWIIKNSPDNPIVRYLIWRRSYKLAKELRKELESKNK